jgi:hypothetical protein
MVLRNPKFAPDDMSIRLLGPGVIDVTKAKLTKGRRKSLYMPAIIFGN